MPQKVVLLDVVGLTPQGLQHAPRISAVGPSRPLQGVLPAVTCAAQATLLTGTTPAVHGIVGNGWYFRETGEIRFWQQSNRLVEADKLYQKVAPGKTAKMFWWYNQGAPVQWSATPKPHYGSDGSKEFGILDYTGCDLEAHVGTFPFHAFWGPMSGLASSHWIASASARVIRQNRPELTLVYLPHLDYDFQRLPTHDPARIAEVDRCAGEVIDAAADIGARVVVVSEYGLVPVDQPVYLNRVLRDAGYLQVRDGPFGEMLMPLDSRAFAVCDHQVAHVYVEDPADRPAVRKLLEGVDGVQAVVDPSDIDVGHRRSGEWVVLAKPNAWFTYYYWNDQARAPDFARSIDIHRKPGYDPCELFMTSRARAGFRLLQKKLGFRYRMDVIPLEPPLVRGSHGLHTAPEQGPVIVGEGAPERMIDVCDYVQGLIAR